MTLLAGYAGQSQADEHMVLVDTIDVGGNGLGTFDISFVDPKLDLYVFFATRRMSLRLKIEIVANEEREKSFCLMYDGNVGVPHRIHL
jgi:hypothetical protein